MGKIERLHLEDVLTPQMNKIKKHIAGKKKKSRLNFFLLSAVSELRSLPGFIPWCPCSVHTPSCSRVTHLYTTHFSSNKFSSRACTWMRGSPQRGWQAAHRQQPACAGAPGKQGTNYFPARQDAGRHGVEGKGKSGGRCNTACSLCSSFPLKILSIWSQVKNNSPLSPPSFKGCSEFPVL